MKSHSAQNSTRRFSMQEAADTSTGSRPFGPALILLAGCLLISYVDRGNLSLAAPLLQKELTLSASQLGILLAAFFWSYTAMQFVAGWIVDRLEVNYVLAAGFLLWSIATAATGIAGSFVTLLAMRLLLGVGESVTFPSSSKILAYHLPEQQRGFANGLLMSAIRLGPAAGTFIAGPLIVKHGWRPVFIGIGLLSLMWVPAWHKWMPSRKPVAAAHYHGPGTVEILAQRSFWGASIGHFAVNYYFYFMLTWLPYYLVHARGLSIETMVGAAGVYYLTDATSAAATGWISDFWMRHGGSTTLVRKSVMGAGTLIAIIASSGCVLAGAQTYFAWLLAAGVGCGMMGVGVFAYSQTLAGPHAAGKWTGLQNGFGNFAGVIGPALTGFVVERTGSFFAPFAITVAILIIGGIAWVYIVGPLQQLDWAARRGASTVALHVA
jgi:MFS family permease